MGMFYLFFLNIPRYFLSFIFYVYHCYSLAINTFFQVQCVHILISYFNAKINLYCSHIIYNLYRSLFQMDFLIICFLLPLWFQKCHFSTLLNTALHLILFLSCSISLQYCQPQFNLCCAIYWKLLTMPRIWWIGKKRRKDWATYLKCAYLS